MIMNWGYDLSGSAIQVGGFQSSDYIAIEGTSELTGDYISGDFEIENEGTVCSGSWDAQPI